MSRNDDGAGSSIVLYEAEDGRTRIECRFEGETLWLTQALMAELFQKDVRTINEHLKNIYDEGELERSATIRKLRMVRAEGRRQVSREIEHYPARRRALAKAKGDEEMRRAVEELAKRTKRPRKALRESNGMS